MERFSVPQSSARPDELHSGHPTAEATFQRAPSGPNHIPPHAAAQQPGLLRFPTSLSIFARRMPRIAGSTRPVATWLPIHTESSAWRRQHAVDPGTTGPWRALAASTSANIPPSASWKWSGVNGSWPIMEPTLERPTLRANSGLTMYRD